MRSGYKQLGGVWRTIILRCVVLLVVIGDLAVARSLAADYHPNYPRKSVVEIETTGASGISIRMAEELASLYDDGATRRALPVVGKNATQNLRDLIQLRGIDIAILQMDVLEAARRQHT